MLRRLFPTAESDPELHPFRSALTFAFYNALTWQVGIGTPMVLFAERLGATPFQVGLAYAWVFLLAPVQIFATALLPRYGFKQVCLGGWAARSFFLAAPMVLALLAPATGRPWMVQVLIWSVFLFCLCRAMGASAMTAWFYGFLPAGARGRYFANDQLLSSVAGVGTLLACAALFALLPIYPALLLQYGIAVTGSTLSFYALKKLPDIERPKPVGLTEVLRATPRHLFGASEFRRYVWLAVWYAVITTPIPPFAAYYLRVGADFTPGQIMLFEVLRYCGTITGAGLIRRRVDATGARPFFLLSLALTGLVAAYWWLNLKTGFGGVVGLAAAYFGVGLGAVCWAVANLNYLPKIIPDEERALFVSLHGAATSLLGGLAPVLLGLWLKSAAPGGGPAIDVSAFGWFFVIVLVSAFVLAWPVRRLREESRERFDLLVRGSAILRPLRGTTYLINLIDPRGTREKPRERVDPPAQSGN